MRLEPSHIRWMIRRDMPQVLAIEAATSSQPWDEETFLRVLRLRHCVGMIAEPQGRDDPVRAFMVYTLHKHSLGLLDLAVRPDLARLGLGRLMIDKLKGKLHEHRRTWIHATLRESNLDAQLFFRARGFQTIEVKRGWWNDTGEDAYRFVYRLPGTPDHPAMAEAEEGSVTP